MTLTLVVLLLILGGCVGFLAGLLGIGGGMIITPFLTLLLPLAGVPDTVVVHMAIATSLATIMFTSISSMRAHHKRGAVRWPIVFCVAPGILLGSMGGAQVTSLLPTFWISLVFVVFVGSSALKMFLGAQPSPQRELPGFLGQFSAGLLIGFISALVGAGGAFISVPMMVYCNVRMHHAVGTSAAIGFPIAVAGTISYILAGLGQAGVPAWPQALGFIHIPAMLSVAAASMLSAPLGAKIAHSINTKPLKKLFACNLFLIASFMLYKAITSY